jgi:dTDP-glucose 4,6-dehydratase
MSRLLVTGGAGFIGSNFVHYWIRRHPEDRLVVLDSLTYAGNLANLAAAADHPGYRFVRGDIRDQELVEELLVQEGLETIVHLAAESHVDRSISGPDIFVDVNINGTHSLLKAARRVWLESHAEEFERPRFHHVSTDEVYGSLAPSEPAFSESTPYSPNSPYAASKAASDHLVRAYQHTYGLPTSISNCSNNYGPYQFPEKLIPLCIVNLLVGKTLPIYGDGQNVRDWLHVEDHCRGIESILVDGRIGETYNIGSRNEQTNLALVRLLCRSVDKLFAGRPELCDRYPAAPPSRGRSCETAIEFVTDRPGHDRRYAIDSSRLEEELGFGSTIAFDTGLDSTVLWFVDNQPWWRAVMDESYRQWMTDQYGGQD